MRSLKSKPCIDVVTGGLGFIGSHLADALVKQGSQVYVLDMPSSCKYNDNRHVFYCDLRIRNLLNSTIKRIQPDRIFHLGALASIVPSIENPTDYYDTNVTGTFNLLEAARKVGVQRYVYAASSSCYGPNPINPISEVHYTAPAYPYALTKLMGEQMVMHYSKVYGLPAISLRIFNAYGPRQRTDGAYGAMFGVFLAQMANSKPVTVVGSGDQTRDFVYVSDVVDAFLKAGACSSTGGIYNVGNGIGVSVNTIVQLLGAAERLTLPRRPGEPDHIVADISEIKNDLNWSPETSIEEGVGLLKNHISDYKNSPLWTPDSIAKVIRAWMKHLA